MGFGYNLKGNKNLHKSGGNHQYFPTSLVRIITLVFVVIALTSLVLDQSDYPTHLLHRSFSSSSSNLAISFDKGNNDDLENILKRAAFMNDDQRTVIITTINAAWMEPGSIFDLFLESFRVGNQTQGLLKHVVVVALDQKAYSHCLEVHPHCFALATDGVNFSGQAFFMGQDYLMMMWRRIDFLRTVLEIGYDFIFTDADIMWLRDPFERFYSDADFQIACDVYKYNSTSLNNLPNGGFTYVRANNKTIQFYKFWHHGKDYFPREHDQDVFNKIKFSPYIGEIGLEIRFLDTAYFGGFCDPSRYLDLVVTMHANCCVGLEKKINDLKMVIEDWKKYMASLPSGCDKNLSNKTWTVPRKCGLRNSTH